MRFVEGFKKGNENRHILLLDCDGAFRCLTVKFHSMSAHFPQTMVCLHSCLGLWHHTVISLSSRMFFAKHIVGTLPEK